MGQNFIACDREQAFLLPVSLRDWLPEDHLAWFVLDAVAEMDLGAFFAAYRVDGWGRAAHDPAMMVALLVYAYAVGERSSRQVERRCREDVAFRVITANQAPDHATIARFRVRHQDALAGLFGEVLMLCARAGIVRVGTIAVDGTKVRANASRERTRDYEDIAREILEQADAVDAAEDQRFGERRGDELPAELSNPRLRRARLRELKRQLDAERETRGPARATRQARLQEAKLRLEENWHVERQLHAEWREWHARRSAERADHGLQMPGLPPTFQPEPPPSPAGRINVTDPDAQMVKSLRGWLLGYNAQAVTTEDQIIVAADVITSGNERWQLEPMLDQALDAIDGAGLHTQPQTVLADAGFFNLAQIQTLTDRGFATLVPPDASGRTTPGMTRRTPIYQQMRDALATEEGRALYRRRTQIIEPVFAHIKVLRRADRFQRRGLPACRSEWRLIAATHNLLKLWRLTRTPLVA